MATDVISLLSIAFVLTTVFCLVLYFLKVSPDASGPSDGRDELKTRETPVQQVSRPFQVEVEGGGVGSIEDGVNIIIKSACPFTTHIFWGVKSKHFLAACKFHQGVGNAEESNVQLSPVSNILSKYSFEQGILEFDDDKFHSPMTCTFRPSAQALQYLIANRSSNHQTLMLIPLVLVVSSRSSVDDGLITSTVIFLINEKTRNGTFKWKIWSEFVQTKDLDVFHLQTLYESAIPIEDQDGAVDQQVDVTENAACIVCHNLAVTRALLPCRHFCICAVCFQRVTLCPVCRCRIESFIKLGDESNVVLTGFEEERTAAHSYIRNMSTLQFIRAVWNAR